MRPCTSDRAVTRSRTSGVTLVELIVTLALLGITGGVVAATVHRARPAVSRPDMEALAVGARSEALASGRAVTIEIAHAGRQYSMTALPDGSVLGDSVIGLDRLSGRPGHVAR